MWEDGVLYVARTPGDVVAVSCPDQPAQVNGKRESMGWSANTAVGQVTFKRRGCACGYRIGSVAFGALVDVSRRLDGASSVESTSTLEQPEDTP
jgi:hypothetical protein